MNIETEAFKAWSARNASHTGIVEKVFIALKEEQTTYALHKEGVYFENYTLEGKEFKIAIFSSIDAVSLNQGIRIRSFKDLQYNTSVKAGYTSEYGLIAFFDNDAKVQMTFQIIGGDSPKETTVQWLNYLGLLLPSDEQKQEEVDVSITKILKLVTLYEIYQLTTIWNGKTIQETEPAFDNSQVFVVCEDKANIRKKEPPYDLIKPEEYLEKGSKVVLVSQLEKGEKPKSLVRNEGEDKEFCTWTGNLKQIVSTDDINEYQVGLDIKSIRLPYSETGHKDIITSKHYVIKEVCGEYSHIYEKEGKQEIDKGWILTSFLIKYNNFENLTVAEKNELIVKESLKATEAATEMTTETACNFCTRNALYLIRAEPALFPKTAPYETYRDPNNNYEWVKLLGYITEPAQALNVKNDFDVLSSISKLKERFEEIKRGTDEGMSEYFLRLQNEADNGQIIIGTMLNSSGTQGHVMMMTPGGLVEITRDEQAWGYTFFDDDIKKVPRVLECGDTDRENEAPLCRNVDRKGAQQRLKWYKYKK
ncbi:MAG: hypothetical protein HC831_26675 [Chloroflexia bacterium]|nr:hypothetical protein [Chloroflexia bacterium]